MASSLDDAELEEEFMESGSVNLNYNNLIEMPESLFTTKARRHIKRIYLKGNLVTKLPKDIGLLSNLVELYLHANKVLELTVEIGLLKSLISLDVSRNCLTTLPCTIGNLSSLEKLILSHNSITALPKEIGHLQILSTLEVMHNDLKALPTEICSCRSLKRLLLDRNKLWWLPVQLCQMQSLEELSVAANKLLYLPTDLGNVSTLKSVYVDSNPYLHALPVGLYAQEIGFNNCGNENYLPVDDGMLPQNILEIEHSEMQNKHIWLPRELQYIGNQDNHLVPSLTELCLRRVYIHRKQDVNLEHLPASLCKSLQQPLCLCQCCKCPLFTTTYPMVFEGQIRVYSLYRLALCCSWRCVKLASLIIQLPLIYPNPSHLQLAVALIN